MNIVEKLSQVESNHLYVVATDNHVSQYLGYASQLSRITLIDCFSDPCGWLASLKDKFSIQADKIQGCTARSHNLDASSEYSEIVKVVESEIHENCRHKIVIVDSLSFLILHGGLQRTLRFLKQIQSLSQGRILAVVHTDLHEDKIVNVLSHAADIIITVASAEDGQPDEICRVDLQKKRSNGSVSFKVRANVREECNGSSCP